jgi:hypothetical protein
MSFSVISCSFPSLTRRRKVEKENFRKGRKNSMESSRLEMSLFSDDFTSISFFALL